jgi:hypothetical protein
LHEVKALFSSDTEGCGDPLIPIAEDVNDKSDVPSSRKSRRLLSTPELIETFTSSLLTRPSLLAPPEICPYPYRIGGEPIFQADGTISQVYWNEYNHSDEGI